MISHTKLISFNFFFFLQKDLYVSSMLATMELEKLQKEYQVNKTLLLFQFDAKNKTLLYNRMWLVKPYFKIIKKNILMMVQCKYAVSYTHLRAHETRGNLVCRLLLEKK